jgi:hypothetical protein
VNTAEASSKPFAKPSRGPATASTPAADGEKPVPVRWEEATDGDLTIAVYRNDDQGAGAEIRRRCEGDPDRFIRLVVGDLERATRVRMLFALATGAVQRDGIEANLDRIVSGIEGPNPSPMERLLIARIRIAWMDLQYREQRAIPVDGASMRIVEHLARMRDRAERRYLGAIRALATIRRLAIPGVTLVTSDGGNQQVVVSAVESPQ